MERAQPKSRRQMSRRHVHISKPTPTVFLEEYVFHLTGLSVLPPALREGMTRPSATSIQNVYATFRVFGKYFFLLRLQLNLTTEHIPVISFEDFL
jgi:hypothetical protein